MSPARTFVELVVACGVRLLPVYRVRAEDGTPLRVITCVDCGHTRPWAGLRQNGAPFDSRCEIEHLCAECVELECAADAARVLLGTDVHVAHVAVPGGYLTALDTEGTWDR